MKKLLFNSILLLGIVGIAVSIVSCETDKGLTIKFNQMNEQIVTILPNSNLRIDTTANITSNLDSILAANNASRDDIASMILTTIDVELCDSNGIVYTSGVNFNEWDSVGIRVFVPNDISVPDVLVASDKVPRDLIGFGVGLTSSDFDFLPYASKQQFAITLLNKLLTPITAKKYVRVKIYIEIGANI
jgi:hypothetical protein